MQIKNEKILRMGCGFGKGRKPQFADIKYFSSFLQDFPLNSKNFRYKNLKN